MSRIRMQLFTMGMVLISASMVAAQQPNLHVRTAFTSTPAGVQETPRAGEGFWVKCDFYYDNPTCDFYTVRFTVEGETVDSYAINWGCGSTGQTRQFLWWGPWYLKNPGTYSCTILLDPGNTVQESNENDNTYTFDFDVVAAADDGQEMWLSWPVSARLGHDLDACTFVDTSGPTALDSFACEPWTYEGHLGTDLGVNFAKMDAGSLVVVAAAAGRVIVADDGYYDRRDNCNNPDPGCGNMVTLDHGNGYETTYCHMKQGSVAVSFGDWVEAGDMLGLVGSSGCSFGPHVHFEVHRDGLPFDPMVGECNKKPQAAFLGQAPVVTSVMADVRISNLCQDPFPAKYYFKPADNLVTIVSRFAYVTVGSTIRWEWVQNGQVYASREVTADDGLCLPTWAWCFFRPNGTGPGSVRILVDGNQIWEQPYLAVDDGHQAPPNELPSDPQVTFRTPPVGGQALWADIINPSFDINYDFIYYQYEWLIGGVKVRDYTTFALSDVLSAGLATAGQTVECRVTASDGTGLSNTVAVTGTMVDACAGTTKLKAKCKGKPDPDLQVTVKSGLPEGTPLTAQLDFYRTQAFLTNNKGAAKITFKGVGVGGHHVCLLECPGICATAVCTP